MFSFRYGLELGEAGHPSDPPDTECEEARREAERHYVESIAVGALELRMVSL